VGQLSKKCHSDQRSFVEVLIEWVVMKSISSGLINHVLFREMMQLVNPEFFVPVYDTLRPHIKGMVGAHRELGFLAIFVLRIPFERIPSLSA
jgi:hypothetical protein